MYQGDIVKDFFKVIGANDLSPKLKIPDKNNESITSTSAIIMSLINQHTSFSVNHAIDYALACKLALILDKTIINQMPEYANSRVYFTKPKQLRRFMQQFEKSNDFVEKQLFTGTKVYPFKNCV